VHQGGDFTQGTHAGDEVDAGELRTGDRERSGDVLEDVVAIGSERIEI